MNQNEANDIIEQARANEQSDPAYDMRNDPQVQEALRVTQENYERGQQDYKEAVSRGDIPEGSQYVGASEDSVRYIPKESMEAARKYGEEFVRKTEKAKQEEAKALNKLESFRVSENQYDLAGAIESGKIEDVREAQKLGLFKPEDVIESQKAAARNEIITERIITEPTPQEEKGLAKIKTKWREYVDTIKDSIQKVSTPEKAKGEAIGLYEKIKAEPSKYAEGFSYVILPGLYTGTHWKDMTQSERCFSMSADLAVIGGVALSWAATAPYGSQFRVGNGQMPRTNLDNVARNSARLTEDIIQDSRLSLPPSDIKAIKAATNSAREALASGRADKILRATDDIKNLPEATRGRVSPKIADELANNLRDNSIKTLKAQDELYSDWLRNNQKSPKRSMVEELKRINKRQLETIVKEETKVRIDLMPEVEKGKYIPAKVEEAKPPARTSKEIPQIKEAGKIDVSKVKPEIRSGRKVLAEPFTIGQPKVGAYSALVWENGRIFVKRMEPEVLKKGFIQIDTYSGTFFMPKAEYYRQSPDNRATIIKQGESKIKPFMWRETRPQLFRGNKLQQQPQTPTKPQTRIDRGDIEVPIKTIEPPKPPPKQPPKTPNKPPIILKGGKIESEEKHREEFRGALTWPQGFGYWSAKEPYSDNKRDFAFFKEPPPGAVMVKQGPGEAYRGIQQLSGRPPGYLKKGMGIVTVTISEPSSQPGRRGAIIFRPTKTNYRRPKAVNLGGGIVRTKTRQHIKL